MTEGETTFRKSITIGRYRIDSLAHHVSVNEITVHDEARERLCTCLERRCTAKVPLPFAYWTGANRAQLASK